MTVVSTGTLSSKLVLDGDPERTRGRKYHLHLPNTFLQPKEAAVSRPPHPTGAQDNSVESTRSYSGSRTRYRIGATTIRRL